MNKEEMQKIAAGYDSIVEFRKSNWCEYKAAIHNGWLNEFFPSKRKPRGYYNNISKDEMQKIATKYNSISEFQKDNCGAYKLAYNNGWLNEFFPSKRKPNGYYNNMTKVEMQKIAAEYNSRGEFAKGNGCAYNVANDIGWLDEFFPKNIRK